MNERRTIVFTLADMVFEYDEEMEKLNKLSKQQIEEIVFTEEELKELENAHDMPIVFDSECPETTPERAIRFKRVNPQRNGIVNNPA